MSNFSGKEVNGNGFMEEFILYVFHYCRNVEEVTFQAYQAPLTKLGTASSLLREYATNLRVIHLHGEEDEKGFPDLRKCLNTRRVSSHSMNTATLVSLLKAAGSALEQLSISIKPVSDSVEVIEAVRKHCKKLSMIHIANLKNVIDIVGQESYSSLICSYGSLLKKAGTQGLCHELLLEVVNACRNLEVTLSVKNEPSGGWRNVLVLGPLVATLFCDAGLLHGDEYPSALKQCSNM